MTSMTSVIASLSRPLAVVALLLMIGCGTDQSTAPASESTPAKVDESTATAPANPALEAEPHVDTNANAVDTDEDADVGDADVADAATETAAGEAVEPTEAEHTSTPPPPVVTPEGPEPRLGTDYRVIDPPQLMASMPGKVEIAEVFSYTCIHCARLDLLMPAWKSTLPEQVNFIYAPMSHGAFEPIARGFYAAQAMGVLEKTHTGMFKALAEQQRLGAGKLNDIAKLYGEMGVDEEALKATANSFTVNTQISRSQRTLARWAIEGTPTLVIAGKYVAMATGDRGHEGLLQTARWLAQKEIMEQAHGD